MKRPSNIAEKVAEEIGAGPFTAIPISPRFPSSAWACAATAVWPRKMFETLASENINLKMIATSEIKISCVIDEKYTELAVRVLHDAFELDKDPRGDGSRSRKKTIASGHGDRIHRLDLES